MKLKRIFNYKIKKIIIYFLFFGSGFGYMKYGCSNFFNQKICLSPKIENSIEQEIIEAFVNRVVDGDTIEVNILRQNTKYKKIEKIRLIGVDTPETKHPTKKVQYFGKEASAYTARELTNEKVILKFDNTTRDRYGRLLCYVYRKKDNFFINYELIYNGFGYAYTKFRFKYREEFKKAEDSARQREVGLWEKKDF